MHDELVTSDDPTAALRGFVALLSAAETHVLRDAVGALVQ